MEGHRQPEQRPTGETARAALFEAVYDELRTVSRALMMRENPGHTLQPTVLVHEAFLRLSQESASRFNDETHFKAVAATIMRRILIDHARKRSTAKRGNNRQTQLTRQNTKQDIKDNQQGLLPEDIIAIDDALRTLESHNPRQARVVELRYFGGLTFEQTARALDVSTNTAKNDWRFARAWLQRQLDAEPQEP